MKLLMRGNKKLPKSTLIWNLPSGLTCIGMTKECQKYCYAKKAERMYPQVLPFRLRNYNISKLKNFTDIIINYLCNLKDNWDTIRIHESGDFYSQEYLDKWFKIINKFNNKIFYAYTKSFQLNFKDKPNNFIIIASDDNPSKESLKRYKKEFSGIAAVDMKNFLYYNCPMDCKICNYCYKNIEYFKAINFKKH